VALIDLLAQRPDQSFTLAEISRRLGIHKQTCHSMLLTLLDVGWLVRHPTHKTYRLGPALAAVGRAVSTSSPLLEYAHGAMQQLADQFGTNVLLLERMADRLAVVDAARPRGRWLHPISIGQEYPLRAPLGGVIVAWDDAYIDSWLGEDRGDTAAFRSSLEIVRRRGYEVRLDAAAPLLDELREQLRALGPDGYDVVVEEFAARLVGQPDELIAIEPGERYSLSGVSAPVFDSQDSPPRYALALTFGSGGGVEKTGAEVAAMGAQLIRSATALSHSAGVSAADRRRIAEGA
jgi:DNA-binding IclR family transcriptional regulator